MGLWDTIKGWLNIGGVKVLLWKYTEPLKRSSPVVQGAALIKSKSNKTVLGLDVQLVEEFTTGKGEEMRTETIVLGRIGFPDHQQGLGYPLEIEAGEDKEQTFTLNFTLSDRLANYSGVLGKVGRIAAFAASEKLEYYLIATAKVQGAAFNPSHKVKVSIGD